MRYLVLFSIGPVQSFIVQARKLQDLQAGSMLLSTLIDVAVKSIGEKNVIFPNDQIESKPNRLLAEIQCESNDVFAEKIEELIRDVNQKYHQNFESILDKKISHNTITQIKQFLNISWSAIQIIGDNYSAAYNKVEHLFAAQKNVRTFSQLSDSECHRKCSLCGERDALFYSDQLKKLPYFARKDAYKINGEKYFSKKEGLCIICYLKRRYFDNQKNIKSISNICLDYNLETILASLPQNIKEKFIKNGCFKNDYDIQGLLRDDLTKSNYSDYFKNYLWKDVQKFVDAFEDVSRYTAMIMFDGDNMGELLSGKDIPEDKLKCYHKEFSKKLGEFAKEAKNIVEKDKQGIAIYAGGDDFLGIVNIKTVLKVITELRNKFNEIVSVPLIQTYDTLPKMTFSAGIVISHHKSYLGNTLKIAREMEHKAKENGKDRLAICVVKRSGEIRKSVVKWGNDCKNIIDIDKIINLLNYDGVSSKFMKQIEDEFEFNYKNIEKYNIADDLLQIEITRLIYRSIKKENSEDKEKIAKQLSLLYNNMIQSLFFDNLFHLFNIIEFIKREVK